MEELREQAVASIGSRRSVFSLVGGSGVGNSSSGGAAPSANGHHRDAVDSASAAATAYTAAAAADSESRLRLSELDGEVRKLREENKKLTECNEELQAQMLNRGLEAGKTLLSTVDMRKAGTWSPAAATPASPNLQLSKQPRILETAMLASSSSLHSKLTLEVTRSVTASAN